MLSASKQSHNDNNDTSKKETKKKKDARKLGKFMMRICDKKMVKHAKKCGSGEKLNQLLIKYSWEGKVDWSRKAVEYGGVWEECWEVWKLVNGKK